MKRNYSKNELMQLTHHKLSFLSNSLMSAGVTTPFALRPVIAFDKQDEKWGIKHIGVLFSQLSSIFLKKKSYT